AEDLSSHEGRRVDRGDSFPFYVTMTYQGSNSFLLVDDNTLYDANISGQVSNPRVMNIPADRISGLVIEQNPPVFGCTDPVACNYYQDAEIDNGSCIYLPVGNNCATCSGETDGTGVIVLNDDDQDGVCNDADECEGYDDSILTI
ncbi:MAG: hypothetical protein AAF193_07670, partial [Bacteroidota bacterium]